MNRSRSWSWIHMIMAVSVILALTGMTACGASLVSYYRFDNDTLNSVGGAPDGTRVGASGANNLPQFVAGTNGLGSALDFDGTDDCVTTTTNGFPNGSGGLGVGSLSFWIKSTDTDVVTITACFDDSAFGTMAFQVQGNIGISTGTGKLSAYLRPLEGVGTSPWFYHLGFAVDHDSNWNDGAWHHIVVTWENLANANYGASILIDGVAQTVTDKSGWRPLNTGSRTYRGHWGGRTMDIGRRVVSAGAEQHIDGTMDDFGVFDGQLTVAEAKAVYNLAVEADLHYDLGEASLILEGYASPAGRVVIENGKWSKVTDLAPGTPGDLVKNGLGSYTLYLTATDGMEGVIIRRGTVVTIQ